MGWFDGNPAHLWQHPPVEAAQRYVEAMGGADAVLERARDQRSTRATTAGSPRSSTTSSSPSPSNEAAPRAAGRGARAARLRGRERDLAQLLPDGGDGAARGHRRHPDRPPRRRHPRPALASTSSSTRWRSASTARAPGTPGSTIDWRSPTPTSPPDRHSRTASSPPPDRSHDAEADATRSIERGALDECCSKPPTWPSWPSSGRLAIEGDGAKLGELLGLLDQPDPGFAIVTPD